MVFSKTSKTKLEFQRYIAQFIRNIMMKISNSKNRKLTIVVGAGGSTPFLRVRDACLTTKLIMKALKDNQYWEDVWEKFEFRRQSHDGGTKDNLELNEVLALRNMLLGTLKGTRFSEFNFEYLIHLMDKASYYLLSPRRFHDCVTIPVDQILQLDALLLGIEGTLHEKFPKSDSGGWRYVPFLSREVIITTMLHAWCELQGPQRDEALALHRKFLKEAVDEYAQVDIYSLNYDPLLLEAIQPLTEYSTGFLGSGKFAPHKFGNTPGTLAVFHGSAGFVPCDGKIMLHRDYVPDQEERIHEIVDKKHVGAFASKGLHANTYLVTGLDKSDHLTLNPYATYLHRFAVDAFDSNAICVIGWSFGDDYIRAFLTNLALERPRQRVVVVDKKSAEEVLNAAKRGDDFLFKVAATTGDHISMHPEDIKRFADDVRKSGFGRFSEHTWFYGKGTKDFYNEAFDRKFL